MQISAANSTSAIAAPGVAPQRGPMPTDGPPERPSGEAPFGEVMARFLQEINGQQLQAGQSIQQFAAGEADSVHDVVLNVAKADLSFRLLMEIRNRLISSYQEIQRMQV